MLDIQINVVGGGLFSLYHQCLETILHLHNSCIFNIYDIRSFRIRIPDGHVFNDINLFDHIFSYGESCERVEYYTEYAQNTFTNISENPDLLTMFRTLVHKNMIQPVITQRVDKYSDTFAIDENTLGVHLRMTDMNSIHGNEYGVFDVDDYIKRCDMIIARRPNINKIFIASDNSVSLQKVKAYYENLNFPVVYIEDSIRNKEEHCNDSGFMIDSMNNSSGVVTYQANVMTEMLVLSKCGYLLHRISDFANMAMIYSTSFKETFCLGNFTI